ncbi:Zn(II)2Cys6 transcription factor domain-containing protein [Aspergillus ibericus CBS 121593]|uniref:Zn(2)-C6 fungal-type domain-containing protein n=1 Tax=Aspergillus ibericus CBS 121593 TaxID=1448316 RepID=A0A395GNJ1_9EURO|nr:hypothetical protein BO80DRAFT_438155 [Aspergillus ibericus CBS 121593]RAK96954.1 hypothetical protein BO80DRAFT_438155 [Aspergillus ibericus CBS 121593]
MAGGKSGPSSGSEKSLRYACDRCHGQKLRCLRSQGADKSCHNVPCLRCQKAQVPCTSSVAHKVGRPPNSRNRKPRLLPNGMHTPYAEHLRISGSTEDDIEEPEKGRYKADKPQGHDLSESGWIIDPDQFSTVPQSTEPVRASFPTTSNTEVPMDTTIPATRSIPSIYGEESDGNAEILDLGQNMAARSAEGSGPRYDCPILESQNEPSPGFNEIEAPHYPQSYGDMYKDESMPHYAVSSSSSHGQGSMVSQTPRNMTTCHVLTGGKLQDTFHKWGELSTQAGASIPSYAGLPPNKFITCLPRLANLNMNLLRLSGKARIATAQSLNPAAGRENEVIVEMVQFSRELIDLMAYITPCPRSSHLPLASQPSSNIFCSMYSSGTKSEGASHSLDSNTHFQHDELSHTASGESTETDAKRESMPASTLIFLVMGCYTQIVYVFETIINCLYQDPTVSASQSRSGSSLETCLHIHTITYLLDHLHKALYAYPPHIPLHDEVDNVSYACQDNLRAQGPGCTTPMFGKSTAGVLLGQASWEIGEREQSLVSKIQSLSQVVNFSRHYS